MERIENKIRGYLAQHLSIISNDLELVKEEYHLKNEYGAAGRIDILAKDQDNNYVIIEIKKSDQAARQALHEIAKYTALLKQELLVKDSEIRIIIVSTTWHELLIPFSQTKKYSLHYLEGYKITLDNSNIPIDAEKIIPVDIESVREFSRVQSLFLYTSNKDIKSNREVLESCISETGLSDYLILELSTDHDIAYPIALYFVFQKLSEEFYLSILRDKNHISSNYDQACELKADTDTTEQEYINFLEQSVIGDALDKMKFDDYEIGYPEKIAHALIKNWKVDKVHRYGFFSKDNRMSDKMIIEEMCGLNGIGLHYYYDQCLSKYTAKLIEIKKGVRECLSLNSVWEGHVDQILDELILDKKEFRVSIIIFNPQDIIGTIASIPIVGFSNAVPNYQIIVQYLNENVVKVFYGIINWRKKDIDFKKIIRKYFYGNDFNYFIAKQFGISELDMQILNDIGLEYSSELLVVENKKESYYDLVFERKKIITTKLKNNKHFDDFLLDNPIFMDAVINLYGKTTNGY